MHVHAKRERSGVNELQKMYVHAKREEQGTLISNMLNTSSAPIFQHAK